MLAPTVQRGVRNFAQANGEAQATIAQAIVRVLNPIRIASPPSTSIRAIVRSIDVGVLRCGAASEGSSEAGDSASITIKRT